jgi:signal transduction histidine kinase
MMGLWGLPATHVLLTIFASSWVARRAGAVPVAHGVVIGLVSVIVGQIVGLYYGPLDLDEAAKYLTLALAGGLLGGIKGRAALAGQEALYMASRSIGAARSPQAVVNAIGDNRASLAVSGSALLWSGSWTKEDVTAPFAGAANGTSWFSRDWPDGLRLDGVDVWALAGSGRGSSRTLRAGELPTTERSVWKERGIRSALLVPLVAPSGERIGLLVVTSRSRRFSRSAVRSYQTIGAQAALALENLRLVEDARQAGVLRERQRMAHEIHDTLAQGFTSIVTNLEATERVMSSDSVRARHHLDHARRTARESLTEARRLVWALRPEPLEGSSLPEALRGLAEQWSKESGIASGVATTGTSSPLPPEVEVTLFRVAQEALTNVRKHAGGASRAALTLSYMGDTIALDVRDDGMGFDPEQDARRRKERDEGGFGLKGMRERVEGAGGTLSIESAPGDGTALTFELPVLPVESSHTESFRNVEEVP